MTGVGERPQLRIYRRQPDILAVRTQASVKILSARELTRLIEQRGDGTLLARHPRAARERCAIGRHPIAVSALRVSCHRAFPFDEGTTLSNHNHSH
jgi:hypothetical protein